MYKMKINSYEICKKTDDKKRIFLNYKELFLSVGMYLPINDNPYTLLIDVHYDKDNTETLTKNIKELKSFESFVAINPELKDYQIIDKLKELNIFSDTIDIVLNENKEYEIVKVNINELKQYKPAGNSILNDIKEVEEQNIEF